MYKQNSQLYLLCYNYNIDKYSCLPVQKRWKMTIVQEQIRRKAAFVHNLHRGRRLKKKKSCTMTNCAKNDINNRLRYTYMIFLFLLLFTLFGAAFLLFLNFFSTLYHFTHIWGYLRNQSRSIQNGEWQLKKQYQLGNKHMESLRETKARKGRGKARKGSKPKKLTEKRTDKDR